MSNMKKKYLICQNCLRIIDHYDYLLENKEYFITFLGKETKINYIKCINNPTCLESKEEFKKA